MDFDTVKCKRQQHQTQRDSVQRNGRTGLRICMHSLGPAQRRADYKNQKCATKVSAFCSKLIQMNHQCHQPAKPPWMVIPTESTTNRKAHYDVQNHKQHGPGGFWKTP